MFGRRACAVVEFATTMTDIAAMPKNRLKHMGVPLAMVIGSYMEGCPNWRPGSLSRESVTEWTYDLRVKTGETAGTRTSTSISSTRVVSLEALRAREVGGLLNVE